MKSLITLSLILFLSLTNMLFAKQVGFSQFQLNKGEARPLQATLWYPTNLNTSQPSLVADNIAFAGTKVIKEATPTFLNHGGKRPLVMLSHGYRGSWRNLNWLATRLVQQGYLVAAVDHPGTTTFNTSSIQAARWWQRPQDLSRLLDYLIADKTWQKMLDENNISAIGHSLGGWTVMQLMGAEFNRKDYLDDCQYHAEFRSCQIKDELGLSKALSDEPLNPSLRDTRFKKAVILDLGLARSFSKSSLNNIKTPTLILGAGIDIGDLPQAQESGFLAEHLPLFKRQYKVYELATHFSFMQPCKTNAIAILEEETPGDSIICKDGVGISRYDLHQQIFSDIEAFLQSAH